MPLIEWKVNYELGIEAVDHEHRELIELLNELHDALLAGAQPEAVQDLLGEVYAKISAHFALEEQMMRAMNYPEQAAHKDDHESLLEDIRDLMDDYEDGRYVDVDEFGRRLEGWFSIHFGTFDARLHRHDSSRP